MALRRTADEAESAAAGFKTFRAPLPEHFTEITALISDLYAISSSLLSLDDLSKDPRYRLSWPHVHLDVELVQSSLKYTVEDILHYLQRVQTQASSDAYSRTWQSMNRFFWDQSQFSLATRLARYRTFIRELNEVLRV